MIRLRTFPPRPSTGFAHQGPRAKRRGRQIPSRTVQTLSQDIHTNHPACTVSTVPKRVIGGVASNRVAKRPVVERHIAKTTRHRLQTARLVETFFFFFFPPGQKNFFFVIFAADDVVTD